MNAIAVLGLGRFFGIVSWCTVIFFVFVIGRSFRFVFVEPGAQVDCAKLEKLYGARGSRQQVQACGRCGHGVGVLDLGDDFDAVVQDEEYGVDIIAADGGQGRWGFSGLVRRKRVAARGIS